MGDDARSVGSGVQRLSDLAAALIDQGSQSALSLALTMIVANQLLAADFALYSFSALGFFVCWGCWRAAIIEPYLVDFAESAYTERSGIPFSLAKLLVRRIAPYAVVAFVAGLLLGDNIAGRSLSAFAVVAPAVALLDGVRAANIAQGRKLELTVGNIAWWVSFGILIGALYLLGSLTMVPAILALGLAALCAGAVSSAIVGIERNTTLQWERFKVLGRPLLVEVLLIAVSVHALAYLIALVTTLEESAGFRGALVLAGPLSTLVGGLRLGILSDAARYRDLADGQARINYLASVTAGLAGAAAVVMMLNYALVLFAGELVLGDTWQYAKPAAFPVMLGMALTSLHLVAGTVLRVRGRGFEIVLIRTLLLPSAIVPVLVGGYLAGAKGAGWGFALGIGIAGPIWLYAAGRGGPDNVDDKVLAWPAIRKRDENPYTYSLQEATGTQGFTTDEFGVKSAIFGRYGIVHVHWPEFALLANSSAIRAVRCMAVLTLLGIQKARGAQIVWTVHNVDPHEIADDRVSRWYLARFRALLSGIIAPSNFTLRETLDRHPELAQIATTTIPLGDHDAEYPDATDRQQARTALGIEPDDVLLANIGQIRSYKNQASLASVVAAAEAADSDEATTPRRWVAIIGGSPRDEGEVDRLKTIAARSSSVRLLPKHVPSDEVAEILSAADLFVAPFKSITNSSSVLLSIGYGCPVLAPDIGSLPELADTIGADWIQLYSGDLTAEIIDTALAKTQTELGDPGLDSFSWSSIGKATAAFYAGLVSGDQAGEDQTSLLTDSPAS